MYRMFTGRLPFSGNDPSEMLGRHLLEEAPPSAPSLPGGPLASGLDAIVRKALRKRPEHRYASMEALLGDLARLERGEPLAARILPDAPDVYHHQTEFSAKAAGFLHRRLGKEPPRS
jgi:serine/threonine-protein kinase